MALAPPIGLRTHQPYTKPTAAERDDGDAKPAEPAKPAQPATTYDPAAVAAGAPPVPQANRPLNADSVKKADGDWAAIKNSGGLTPSLVARRLQEHANDPDYRARLMANVAKDGRLHQLSEPFKAGSKGEPNPVFSDAQRKAIASSLEEARKAGMVSDVDLRQAAENHPAVRDLVKSAGVDRLERTPEERNAVNDVRSATAEHAEKKKKVDEKNTELARLLRTAGPAMKDDQKQRFVEEFKKKNQSVYDDEAKAAEKLAKTIEKHGPALEQAALTSKDDAKVYADALKSLASSGRAGLAVEKLGKILTEGGPLAEALGGDKKLEKMMGAAIEHASTEYTLETGDPEKATKKLLDQLRKTFDTGKKLKGAAERIQKSVRELGETLENPAKHTNDVKTLTKKYLELAKKGPVGKALAVVGVTKQMLEGAQNGLAGDWARAIRTLGAGTKEAAEMMAGSIGAMSRLGQAGPTSEAVKRLAARLVPALGAAINAASTWEEFQKLRNSKNVGYAVAVMGGAIATFGSLVGSIPGVQPVGAVFTAVGLGLQLAGNLLADTVQDGRDQRQLAELLTKAGLDPKSADVISKNPQGFRALADGGLSREQLLEIVTAPNAAKVFGSLAGPLAGVVSKLREYGATPDQVKEILLRVTDRDAMERIFKLIQLTERPGGLPHSGRAYREDVEGSEAERQRRVREMLRRLPEVGPVLGG